MADTQYANLRENVPSHLANLSDAQLAGVMAINGIDAEAMEGFFDDLKGFAANAGKTLLSAAPSILPTAGSVLGGLVGGPLGAQLGGTLGSVAGKFAGAAAQPGGVQSAASQLLQTVTRPETIQALGSMAMGALGKKDVSVGGTSVPVAAFGNLLKTLIGNAEAEYSQALTAAEGDGTPSYMHDFSGQAVSDPAVPLNRAVALYQLLQTAKPSEMDSEADAEAEYDMEAEQAEWDEMELAEVYDSEEA
jgi:hypothetical protein